MRFFTLPSMIFGPNAHVTPLAVSEIEKRMPADAWLRSSNRRSAHSCKHSKYAISGE